MPDLFRTIGFPEHLFRPVSGSFRLRNFQIGSESLLPRMTRVSGQIEQLWSCSLQMPPMEREDWQEHESFFARLSGQAVLFEMRPPVRRLPLGAGAGFAEDNPEYEITGTTITGTEILTGSTTALVLEAAPRYAQAIKLGFGAAMADQNVLKHGDVFGLCGNLYMCVANVTADENGEARVPFRWRLWKGAQVNDVVHLRKPTLRVQLVAPDEGGIEFDAAQIGRGGFSAREVPYLQ